MKQEAILHRFTTPIKHFLEKLSALKLKFDYSAATIRNRYPCKMVGERRLLESKETIILYTIFGKRDVYEISIKKLLENPDLVEKFNPKQAVKFGIIAIGDILFNVPAEEQSSADKQRLEKYKQIATRMLDK